MSKPSRRPHILIFNPDQWRGDVLGHVGNRAAVTPALDAMVNERTGDAVSFRYAFCQNPVCTPSRCSFMSGWYPHVRGHRTMFHMMHAEHGEPVLLKTLKDSGYHVWWGGKNDLVPGQDGFAHVSSTKFNATDADFKRWGHTPRPGLHGWTDWRGTPESDTYYSFYAGKLDKRDDSIYCAEDWPQVLGAIDFIRKAPRDKPLCIYLPLAYPHPPYGVEEPWFSMIDRAKLPPRVKPPPDFTGKASILGAIHRRQQMQSWSEERWTELRATYYGMCARVDHQFKMVLDALREAGLYDDTAAFFFSDHGDYTGDFSLVEKTQNTFEDCLTRVPLIVKPPRGTPVKPRVTDAMAELIDFTATVYDITGIDPGYDHFGRSLLPVLAGDTDTHRDAVFCEGGRLKGETQAMERGSAAHIVPTGLYYPRVGLQSIDDPCYHTKGVMCRTRDFKYVRRLYESDELYDLRNDPNEMNNVVNDPRYASMLAELRLRTLTWFVETADVVPRVTDSR